MIKNLLLFIFFCNYAYSQQQDSPGVIIKIDVVQLVDPASFPNLQLQVEKHITSNFSIIGGVGLQIYKDTPTDTAVIATRGLKLNLETRFYQSERENRRHPGHFIGLQAFYRANQKSESVYYSTTTNTYAHDEFGVKKVAYGINFVYGYQFIMSENRFPMILEPHFGFGVMNRKVTNYDLQYNPEIDEDSNNHGFALPSNLESASGIRPNITLGFRIGYKF